MRSAGNFNSEWGYLAPAPSFMRTARVVLVATAVGATAGAAVVLSLIDRPASQSEKSASVTAHAIVTAVQAAPATGAPVASAASVTPVTPVNVTTAAPAVAPKPVVAAPVTVTPVAVQTKSAAPIAAPQVAVQPPSAVTTQSASVAPPQPASSTPTKTTTNMNESAAVAPPQHAPGMAALSETTTMTPSTEARDETLVPPAPIPAEKKLKYHSSGQYASKEKDKQPAGLGTVLKRLFNPPHSASTSYYPNR